MKTTKFEADLATHDEFTLNALVIELEVRNRTDFLAKALAFMNWAVHERKRGNRIAAIDEKGDVVRELVIPEIEKVAPDFNLPSLSLTWTAEETESFAKLASEEQPKPTPQLIRAMKTRSVVNPSTTASGCRTI